MELLTGLVWMTWLTCCVTSQGRDYVEIEVGRGSLRGYRENVLGREIHTFLGIPYAKPPVNELRFMRPEPASPWTNTRNATQLPNSCHQMIDTMFNRFEGVDMWNPNTKMSEDCLYLNVWAPAVREGQPAAKPKTVMAWIYGGGLYSGTSTLELYDGRIMAATADVVVVSMQYRVGILGFAYLGISDAPGNQGLLDQQLALQWIFNNIDRFGGDKYSVTVFGESAGAFSSSLHLLSPLTRDYVKHAIMQSSSALVPWGIDPQKVAKKRTLDTAALVGCPAGPEGEVLRCLKKADPQAMISKMWQVPDSSMINTPLVATIDGYYLAHHPREYINKADFKKASILLGTNRDEGYYFLYYSLPELFNMDSGNKSLSKEQYRQSIKKLIRAEHEVLTDAVAFEYGVPCSFSNSTKYRDALDDMYGDVSFICPLAEFAEAYAGAGQDVFMYQFLHRTSANPWPKTSGVMHGYEIDHVFGAPLNTSLNYTKEEQVLSENIIRYWTNFAKTGDPNKGEDGAVDAALYTWPQHTITNKEYITLDTAPSSVKHGLRDRQCHFWEELIPRLKAATENGSQNSGGGDISSANLNLLLAVLVYIHASMV